MDGEIGCNASRTPEDTYLSFNSTKQTNIARMGRRKFRSSTDQGIKKLSRSYT